MLRVTCYRGRESVFRGEATTVVLPSDAGELSILEWHAPLVCALGRGTVQIDDTRVPICGGVAKVGGNTVIIVAG